MFFVKINRFKIQKKFLHAYIWIHPTVSTHLLTNVPQSLIGQEFMPKNILSHKIQICAKNANFIVFFKASNTSMVV